MHGDYVDWYNIKLFKRSKMLKRIKKKIISILHWKHRNVVYRSGIDVGEFERFGYYECLKCSRKEGILVIHKIRSWKK